MFIADSRDMSDSDHARMSRKRIRRKFWKMVLFTLFLVYPGVSKQVLSYFDCKYIGPDRYLMADFSIKCGSPRWNNNLPYACGMLLIYPVGIPAAFFFFLWRYHDRLDEPGVRLQLGFLYEAYDTDVWFFEICDMIHKVIMVALLSFFPFTWHMPGGMVVVILFLQFMLLAQPYARKGDDRLALLCQMELYHIILAGYILTNNPVYDSRTDAALSAMLITITVGLMIAFILLSVRSVRKALLVRARRLAHAMDARLEDDEEPEKELSSKSSGQPISGDASGEISRDSSTARLGDKNDVVGDKDKNDAVGDKDKNAAGNVVEVDDDPAKEMQDLNNVEK